MGKGSFEVEPGLLMAAGCHHRRNAREGACGPCYARLSVALDLIGTARSLTRAQQIVDETHAAMTAEAPARKAARRG